MTVSTVKMTARQFLLLGEDPPGVRLELVDGEIAVSPSPTPEHSYIDTQLRSLINGHVKAHDLGIVVGDVDTIFGIHDVRRPDLVYFAKARQHLISRKVLKGPPDLCVEIVSSGSKQRDRKDKFKQYAKGAVPYYWIVDPEPRTIEAYELVGKKYELAEKGSKNDLIHLPPFLDLAIPLREIWFPW